MDRFQRSIQFAVSEDWKKARRQAIYRNVVCAVTQCSVKMRSFADIQDLLHLDEMQYRGLQEIPLERIKGSVGRFDDFTSAFLPRKDHMQERWQKVDRLVRQGKAPPIEVYQVDQAYFVVDGNHRVSTARQNDLKTIQAHVTSFSSPFTPAAGADIDQMLIEAEQQRFMDRVGTSDSRAAEAIRFTCAGCYRDLAGQIDAYRLGMELQTEKPVSFQEAFSAWYEEVYSVAVESIRQEDMLELFPERTEADLFIWAWQNSSELEERAADDESLPGD
jgi:uncharacterized ParB-like nuclease family protein